MTTTDGRRSAPLRFVIVTLDAHLASAAERAARVLAADDPAIDVVMHVAADWMRDPATIEACRRDLATADLIVVTQLFMEDQVTAIGDVLAARCDRCLAVMVALCAPELMRCTRMRGFSMGKPDGPGAVVADDLDAAHARWQAECR